MKEFFNKEMYNEILKGNIDTIPSLIEYLQHKGAEGIDGSSYLLHPQNCNIVIWANVSDEFINCLNSFQERYNDICYYNDNMTPILYVISGHILRIPLIEKGRIDYKTAHWFPVIITSEKKLKGDKNNARRTRTI